MSCWRCLSAKTNFSPRNVNHQFDIRNCLLTPKSPKSFKGNQFCFLKIDGTVLEHDIKLLQKLKRLQTIYKVLKITLPGYIFVNAKIGIIFYVNSVHFPLPYKLQQHRFDSYCPKKSLLCLYSFICVYVIAYNYVPWVLDLR